MLYSARVSLIAAILVGTASIDGIAEGLSAVTGVFGIDLGGQLPDNLIKISRGNVHDVRPPDPHSDFSYYSVETTKGRRVFQIDALGYMATHSLCELAANEIRKIYEKRYRVTFTGPTRNGSPTSLHWTRWTASEGKATSFMDLHNPREKRLYIGCDTHPGKSKILNSPEIDDTTISLTLVDEAVTTDEKLGDRLKNNRAF